VTQPKAARGKTGLFKPPAPRLGTIESIAFGLSLVWARPWLLLPPLALDVVLWLGPRISVRPLANPIVRVLREQGGADGGTVADTIVSLGERANLSHLVSVMLPSLMAGTSKDTLLSALVALTAPPLVSGVERDAIFGSWGAGLFGRLTPANAFAVIGAGVGLALTSTIITMLYRVPLAKAVRDTSLPLVPTARLIVVAWARFVALLSLVAAALALVTGPLLIGASVLLLLGINIAPLVGLGLLFGGGLLALYLHFALDAILVSEVGPLRAIYLSFNVSRGNVGQTAGFGLASLLIASGTPRALESIVGSPPGIAVALLVNAFMGTGLVLASMIFYQDRVRLL